MDRVHGIVDKGHVNVDGMNPRNTELDTNLMTIDSFALKGLHCGLGVLTSLVLNESPVVNYAVLDGYLQRVKDKETLNKDALVLKIT